MLHTLYLYTRPYTLKKINPIILNTVKYSMGWFNDNKQNDNKQDDDSNSRNNIDWDAYDKLNNIKENEPDSRGVIEAPANAETIIYESPEGDTYEIPISDLIEADDDNEITYTAPKKQDYYRLNPIHRAKKQYIATMVAKQRYFTFSR